MGMAANQIGGVLLIQAAPGKSWLMHEALTKATPAAPATPANPNPTATPFKTANGTVDKVWVKIGSTNVLVFVIAADHKSLSKFIADVETFITSKFGASAIVSTEGGAIDDGFWK